MAILYIVGEEDEVSIADVAGYIIEAMEYKGEVVVSIQLFNNYLTARLLIMLQSIIMKLYFRVSSLIQVKLMDSLKRRQQMPN